MQKTENAFKKVVFQNGTTLANPKDVRKVITYKGLTLAIGILVAVLIALTLWPTKSDKEVSGPYSSPGMTLPAVSKNLFKAAIRIFRIFDNEDFQ